MYFQIRAVSKCGVYGPWTGFRVDLTSMLCHSVRQIWSKKKKKNSLDSDISDFWKFGLIAAKGRNSGIG